MDSGANRIEMTLCADGPSIREAREAAATAAVDLGAGRDVVEDIRLCVSEIVSNVVRHAYPDGTGEVNLSVDRNGRGVLVVVRDFGVGTTMRRASDDHDGGFGWKIVRTLADRYAVVSTPEDGTEVWMSFGTISRAVRPRPRLRAAHRRERTGARVAG
jgi:anti-sigma regulatory factor (Ser/Thr protein kinase)